MSIKTTCLPWENLERSPQFIVIITFHGPSFFVLRFMAQVLNMRALNPREKQGSVTIMVDRENDIGKIFTTSLLGTKTNFCMWKAI